MSLNSIYIKPISVLTILFMLWDTFGWFGANLVVKYGFAEEGEHHCMVSFCACAIEEGRTFCTCRHPELQHKNKAGRENGQTAGEDGAREAEVCFYPQKKHDSDKNKAVIVVISSEYHAVLQHETPMGSTFRKTGLPSYKPDAAADGFHDEIERPPRT